MDTIKLVCFDLDQTLITENSWKELNLALGMSEAEDKQLYTDFVDGKISYEKWNDLVLERYLEHEGANRENITDILSQYTYQKGAREVVNYLRERDYELVLISGSIDIIVAHVARDLGISYAKANNTFIFDEQDKLLSIHTHGNDTVAKAEHLESFCEMLDIKITECACVGDGANDIELFRRTKHGITFNDSPITADAWVLIDTLEDIPSIL